MPIRAEIIEIQLMATGAKGSCGPTDNGEGGTEWGKSGINCCTGGACDTGLRCITGAVCARECSVVGTACSAIAVMVCL